MPPQALRAAYSEHCIYKPSIHRFIESWNDRDQEKSEVQPLSVDSLQTMWMPTIKESAEADPTISEVDLRELRRQEKRARRERRRNSVLIQNRKLIEDELLSLPRASSHPDIRAVQSTTKKDKRVAFALEPLILPENYIEVMVPQTPSAKPILVRKRRVSCIPPQDSLMDYETFAAWRRGSRMSLDVAAQEEILAHQAKLRAQMEAQRKQQTILAQLSGMLKMCFVHRTRTSPVNWLDPSREASI